MLRGNNFIYIHPFTFCLNHSKKTESFLSGKKLNPSLKYVAYRQRLTRRKEKENKNIHWLNLTKWLLGNYRKTAVSFSSSCPGTVKHFTYVYFDKTTALCDVITKRMWLRLSGFNTQTYHKSCLWNSLFSIFEMFWNSFMWGTIWNVIHHSLEKFTRNLDCFFAWNLLSCNTVLK